MRNILIALLLFPMIAFAQQKDTTKLLTASKELKTKERHGWIRPLLNWHWKAGDNPQWANPLFEDSNWHLSNLNEIPYSSPQIPAGSIVWLRMRIKNDSSFAQPLIMRIWQSGASEIYLDGKLIHSLGFMHNDPRSSIFYSPGNGVNLSFPLINDSNQLLAVRFLNIPEKYPFFFNSANKGYFNLWLAKQPDGENDYYKALNETTNQNFRIVSGAATLLAVLFLSLYFFFKTQRVNLIFSLCCFFLAAAMFLFPAILKAHSNFFLLRLSHTILATIYLLLILFCIYKILDHRISWQFWIIFILGVLTIPGSFLVNSDFLALPLIVLANVDALRVTTKSVNKNKSPSSRILQICLLLNLAYWICLLLAIFSILNSSFIYKIQPFAFLLNPLGLAIFIGYSFGTTSQSLRQKLKEVEELSTEKQQILTSQNETLEKQVTERTAALNQSLQELKSTQQQLIQSEKMASLGELTAGIAHEIQNPLNFVNNFSEVSVEMIEELNEELDKRDVEEAKAIASDIQQNLGKINHHGKRAGAIVKRMLQHSQKSAGQKEPTNINALADEYLRLSYHGLRAKEKLFNADFTTDFDERIGKIEVVPQDIGRVLLNLYNNAFYSVNEKKTQNGETYKPFVLISTRKINAQINISIRDNGIGIPQKVLDKIYQPFFTTKPTGEGTGLGLSLSYDIITKTHNGKLEVKSIEGEFAKFIITLPIT